MQKEAREIVKKILNSIGRFFAKIGAGIYKVIDVILITPISKLIYFIIDKAQSNPGKFERFLNKPNVLIYVSLLCAFVTFIVIDQKVVDLSETEVKIISNVKVEAEYNDETFVAEGIPETVDVILMGRKSDLYLAEQLGDHKVTLDLSDYSSGTYENISLKYNNPINTLDYKIDPSKVTIVLYPKVSEVRTLTIDILNTDKLDETLVISSVKLSKDEVIIKSYSEKLETVASVKAIIDANALKANSSGTYTLENVQLVAYDEKGTEISDVEIIPSTITATVVVSSPSKEVPIKIVPIGEVASGSAIASIVSSSNKATLYGDQSVLDEISVLEVEIDVNGLKEDKTYQTTITKPTGVRSMSVSKLTIKLTMEKETSKEFENIAIQLENLKNGYKAFGVSESDTKVTVVVKGTSSLIEKLTSADITAAVDLTDLDDGDWTVPVKVTGADSKLTYTSKTSQVKITIAKQ